MCRSLFQSHMLHSFDEFLLFHIMSRSSVLGHFSSGTLGLLGLKGLSFNFSKGGGVGIQLFKKKKPLSLPHSANQLLSLFSPSLPGCDWPFTFRRPVTFRHPLWYPLMWYLFLCTVGVNHTPWDSDVEFHTMVLLACVVWGLRGGLEIKGQPVWGVNSREQYFTCATFSQRMWMSVYFLDV